VVQLTKQYTALILAAGCGSRMKDTAKNLPKCLLKYKKKTILDYIVEHLIKLGFKKINIALGYKSNKIITSLEKYKNINFTFYKVKNYRTVGSAYSWYLFRKIWNYNKKSIIVMHADIFFHYNLIKMVSHSKKKNVIASVSKNKDEIKINGWIIKNYPNNLIKEIKKKVKKKELFNKEIACINKFSSETMKYIFNFMENFFLKNGKNYTWEILLNEIIKKNNIKIYTNSYNNYWLNLNTKTDYKNLKRIHKIYPNI